MRALEENSRKSSMRIALFTVIASSAMMVLMLCSYMVVSMAMSVAINWNGISMFLGAIGVFLTPAFTGKAIQKRFEKDT